MLRALLLLACTAKVAAFAQAPAGEPGCVDMDPDVIQSAFVEAIQDVEVEGVPTITSCADVAASGGCADEEVAASCCATCALPQRVTYSVHARVMAFIKCVMHQTKCIMIHGLNSHHSPHRLPWGHACQTTHCRKGPPCGPQWEWWENNRMVNPTRMTCKL